MLKRPYRIEPYNPEWRTKYERIQNDITESFGNKALMIQHVGSTSIPGMSAKAVIDVLVTIAHIEPFIHEKEEMVRRGYKWEDEYINPNTILFYQAKEDEEKLVNIHVVEKGSFDEEKLLLTTNYLKAHPERVQMYKDLKASLYKQYPDDYPAYRAGKQDFLKETQQFALKELDK